MVKGRFLLFLNAVVIALGIGSTAPRAADETDCSGTPDMAVRALPAPLGKWGHITCTKFGHMLTSRQGWIWAWLDGTGSVSFPSQMVRRRPAELGNTSYFVTIAISDLEPEELAFAFSTFVDGLGLNEGQVKGYRVDLTSVSGRSTTVYFFDFETFAGGIWCPDGGCLPDWRFMIMERDHRADAVAASI